MSYKRGTPVANVPVSLSTGGLPDLTLAEGTMVNIQMVNTSLVFTTMIVSTYADDVAAGNAGLTTGQVYADPGGILRVKL